MGHARGDLQNEIRRKGGVHTHGDACTALACHRQPLPAFHYMIASFGGAEVPCADYAPFGSKALAKSAAAALVRHNACLLANHGMICFGSDIRSAAIRALKLEMLARQYILAKQLGEPHLLSETEVAEAARRYAFYGVGYIPEAQ
jgi:L-fuculose-phosphate aldolase